MGSTDAKSLGEDLLASLWKQRSKGNFCDVQLTDGESKLWAHSCILATVCPFLLRYFVKHLGDCLDWSVQKPMQLSISTLTKCKGESRNNCMDCVADTLDFVYTGKIKLKDKHLDHVLNLANNLELDNLLLICRKFRIDNNIDIFQPIPAEQSCELTEYSCESCGFKSQDGELFLIHDLNFHKNNFACLACNFEDNCVSNLVDHVEQCDNHVCSVCLFKGEDASSLKLHLIDHKNEKPFVCKSCCVRFHERSEWLKHFSSNCQSNQIDSCPTCKLSFPDETITRKHIRIFHKNKYTCLSCEYSTYKIDKIVSHLKVADHSELFCSVCLQETHSKQDLCSHLEEHLLKLPYRCKPCRAAYPNRRQWWRHMSSHFDEKPFSCSQCQLKFKNKVLLNTHILRLHKKKKYICSVCGLAAPFPSLLEKHKKSHQTHKQEFACSKCNFKTNYKNNFLKHKKEHSLPKSKSSTLQCSICKIFFSLEKNLNRHMKFQHNSEAQQFKCPKCNYLTVRLDKIKDHCIKVHCMGEKESSEVMKSLKTSQPIIQKKPEETSKVVQLRIEESGQVIVQQNERLQSNDERYAQLQVDNNGNVTILQRCENKSRRHLQVGDDGSIILQENNRDSNETNFVLRTENGVENKNYSEMEIEEMKENVLQEFSNINRIGDVRSSEELNKNNEAKTEPDKSQNTQNENTDVHINNVNQQFNDSVKKTLFLNKTTGEINILSTTEGKPIPIANVTATNLLTIGNFREGTGSVTLNESTGVLTFNNINSGSTGAVFLNESTGELSYIDLNRENSEELYNQQVEFQEMEQTQLDEVTGEIIKVDNNKNHREDNAEDIFDFDMENFNEDSFDGFDDFDELLFDNVGMESHLESQEECPIQRPPFIVAGSGSQTPRLDEMTGEFTFDDSCTAQDIWNDFKPFRDAENDSILDNVNNSSYHFLLNEITGEFYK